MGTIYYFLFSSILIFYILLFFYINGKQYNPRFPAVSIYLYLLHTAFFMGHCSPVFCVCFVCNKPPYVTNYIRYIYLLSLIYLSSLQLQTTLYLIICSLRPSLFLITILQYTSLLSLSYIPTIHFLITYLFTLHDIKYSSFFLIYPLRLSLFHSKIHLITTPISDEASLYLY